MMMMMIMIMIRINKHKAVALRMKSAFVSCWKVTFSFSIYIDDANKWRPTAIAQYLTHYLSVSDSIKLSGLATEI